MDGHSPELTDAQRLDALVGQNEASKRLQLEAAVGVGHVGPGQPIDARGSREVAGGDLWQPAVVAFRKVVSDLSELLVHDVEVVEEPFLGERDLTLLLDRLDDIVVRRQKYAPVLADPGKKTPSLGGCLGDSLGRGEALGVLLEALDPEQLGADRRF